MNDLLKQECKNFIESNKDAINSVKTADDILSFFRLRWRNPKVVEILSVVLVYLHRIPTFIKVDDFWKSFDLCINSTVGRVKLISHYVDFKDFEKDLLQFESQLKMDGIPEIVAKYIIKNSKIDKSRW